MQRRIEAAQSAARMRAPRPKVKRMLTSGGIWIQCASMMRKHNAQVAGARAPS